MSSKSTTGGKTCQDVVGRWLRGRARTLTSSKFWYRRLPMLDFLRRYDGATLLSDFISGITIGITFIPSCMASAAIAGLPPQYGLYSVLPCYFIYAILGSEACVVAAPTVLTAMLCTPYVDQYGYDVIFTLCFYSGCIVLLLGILNMGFVVDFISTPVLEGFISGAGINVISSQISKVLGIPGGGSTIVEYWDIIIKGIQDYGISLWDTVLGVISIAALIALQYVQRYSIIPEGKKVSRTERVLRVTLKYLVLGRTAVVVLISTCIIAALTPDDGEPPVHIAGNITEGFPDFKVPPFTIQSGNYSLNFQDTISELSTGLIAISIIIVTESTAAALIFARGPSIDAVQEFLALGTINVFGSFIQAIPCASSISRTTVNHHAGVRTQFGGLFAGCVIVVALGLLSSTLRYLPDATLAAVVICAVAYIIDIHHYTFTLWRSNKLDLITLYATFFGCLFTGLDYGILIGIAVNIILLLIQVARPEVEISELKLQGHDVLLVRPDRSVNYTGANHVRHLITKSSARYPEGLIVIVDGIHFCNLDATTVKVFKILLKDLQKRNYRVIFWNWKESFSQSFINHDKIDPECFYTEENLDHLIRNLSISKHEVIKIENSNET